MTVSFNNEDLEHLYKTPLGKIKKAQFSKEVIKNYQKCINLLMYADDLRLIEKINGLNLEKLKGDQKGHFSIRVNKQYRVIFRILAKGKVEVLILELSKHYE